MFERILVAIDPSAARKTALQMAGELARPANATVHVLHVVPSMVAGDTVVKLEEEAQGEAILEEALATLRDLGVEAEGQLAHSLTNQVPAAISAAVEDFKADLLVVSPHHRGAVAAFFNPRVSDAVAHAGGIAVLLAPEVSR
ncbi:universal stress protein [Streptomyces olivaceoviridis]|uniref:universal stress protein n=1 Tax=Streptomyces olivaceoviridis TaxID=1921 RepID=UPI00167BC34B|nr:universal stress protein [Streptomyces olivaceoviridis]GGZ26040.1 universal stress protein [Streptomyces olivaceoviridis]